MEERYCLHDPEAGQWITDADGRRRWLPVPPVLLQPCSCGTGLRCPFCDRECLDQGEGTPASSPAGVDGGGVDGAGVPSCAEDAP
jgi:hypothetical protein